MKLAGYLLIFGFKQRGPNIFSLKGTPWPMGVHRMSGALNLDACYWMFKKCVFGRVFMVSGTFPVCGHILPSPRKPPKIAFPIKVSMDAHPAPDVDLRSPTNLILKL